MEIVVIISIRSDAVLRLVSDCKPANVYVNNYDYHINKHGVIWKDNNGILFSLPSSESTDREPPLT